MSRRARSRSARGWAPLCTMFGVAWVTCAPGIALKAQEERGLTSLAATRERPLFSPTRRPPPTPVVVAPTAPAPETARETPPPAFRLTGVVIGDAEEIAIVQHDQNAKPINLRINSVIDGWTVAAIHSREIVLRHEDHTITVRMADQVTGSEASVRSDE